MIEDLLGLTSLTLISMTPILLASVGEILTERSGIVNIGIEGIFLLSSFTAILVSFKTGNPYLGLLVGFIVGFSSGALHAFLSLYLKSDQIIIGVGFNMLAYGLGVFGLISVWNAHGASPTLMNKTYTITLSLEGYTMIIQPIAFIAIGIAVLIWWILYRTSIGIMIRACGEDPRSAEISGVNIYLIRILATAVGGGLAGLGGAFLSVSWIGQYTRNIAAGRGFIALANVAFSNWNPLLAIAGAMLFSFFDVLSTYIPIKLAALYGQIFIAQEKLFLILPYLSTLVVVILIARKIRMPRVLGQPYVKE
ncbi:MAG: ABC transporter permease [Sulfolobales archaeon]